MNKNKGIQEITSPANPRVKAVRKLRQNANDDPEHFLIVGSHHIGSAMEAGWIVEELYITADTKETTFGTNMVKNILKTGGEVFQVSGEVFHDLSDKDYERGMLAVARKKAISLADLEGFSRIVALVKPQDPGNVGTILRTLDAVGGGGLIILDGGIKPYHPSFLRASMGSVYWNPVVTTDFETFNLWRLEHGIPLVGTSAKGKPSGSRKRGDDRVTVLFGSEQKGLDPDQIEACDELISLPMKGHHSSLNIAVAAGIILYQLFG